MPGTCPWCGEEIAFRLLTNNDRGQECCPFCGKPVIWESEDMGGELGFVVSYSKYEEGVRNAVHSEQCSGKVTP